MTGARTLFAGPRGGVEPIAEGAAVLKGFVAMPAAARLVDQVHEIAAAGPAPFRHMVTPGGWEMSVEMTNCGTPVGSPTGGLSLRFG